MDLKDLREHIRGIISDRVYGKLNEENGDDIYNDFIENVKRQNGIKNDSERPLTELEGTAFVFGNNYDFEFDYEVTSRNYVKSRGGDNYNEPYFDELGGDFDFNIIDARITDKNGNTVDDFDVIAERLVSEYDTVKEWFVFDPSVQVDDELNEVSTHKKHKIKKNAINAIDGKSDNVETFLIITAENPMAAPSSNKTNRNANTEMVSYLKSGNYAWQPVRGKYGNTENTKIIFNISLSEAKRLGLYFKQESFIYGTKENGVVNFDLYMINDSHSDYNLAERQQKYDKIGREQKDFYTAIDSKHKFSVPYEYFKEACDKFNGIVNEAKTKSEKYRNVYNKCLNECLAENKTGRHYYINRSLIYGGLKSA